MIDLPSKYFSECGKYKQHNGKNKLSYSQIGSWEGYLGDYIAGKFLEVDVPGNIFSYFGNYCGDVFETGEPKDELSDEDNQILLELLPRPDNAVYEAEIVIDRGDYVIQGFIDQELHYEEGIKIYDLKTGNHKDKALFYASKEYKQTGLYSYARDLEGYKILDCGVILLERKGNGREGHPLRLSGEVLHIDTPYVKEEVEQYLKAVDKYAKEISEHFKVYKKYFT